MRICFLLKVRPEKLQEYRVRYASVWPEMRSALRETGWRNYSLFLRDDGVVVGYLETDNFETSMAAMQAQPVNARWQAEMAPLFECMDGAPDESMIPLEEIFHLD